MKGPEMTDVISQESVTIHRLGVDAHLTRVQLMMNDCIVSYVLEIINVKP